MGLFEPIWMTDEAGRAPKAVAAVNRVSDQAELAKIAREAPLETVRAQATSLLTDQEALLSIAACDRSRPVRRAAIGRMDDEHLVLFAGKVPNAQCIEAARPNSPEDEEVVAVGRIGSSEALADLYILLKRNHWARFKTSDRPYWSNYGERCRIALEGRMGEAECAIAVRKLLAKRCRVDPTGFLGSRIQSPVLRRELGIDLDKAELMERFEKSPGGNAAKILWPLLDDGERRAMQRAATDYLCDGRMLGPANFEDLIGFIDDRALLARLLMSNPNHEGNLMRLVAMIDNPGVLNRFLEMLGMRKVYGCPAVDRPPDPSQENFIVHMLGADGRVLDRLRRAVENRMRELENGEA